MIDMVQKNIRFPMFGIKHGKGYTGWSADGVGVNGSTAVIQMIVRCSVSPVANIFLEKEKVIISHKGLNV